MTKPKPKACDKCGLADRCKGERYCRRCYVRMFGHEPETKGNGMKLAALIPVVFMAGCGTVDSFIAQNKPSGAHPGFPKPNDVPCDGGWWAQIAGLGVLNWGGGLLMIAGMVAGVASFTPLRELVSLRMAIASFVIGLASVLLYNTLSDPLVGVIVSVLIGVGGITAVLAYRHWIWEKLVGIAELIVQKDLDKSGGIGPKG